LEDGELVGKRAPRTLCGQMRILEAVAAALIIFVVFSAATFLNRSSDVKTLQERGDLDRLGYNMLSRMIESGIIEETVENSGSTVELQVFVQRSLPMATFFNLTIVQMEGNDQLDWVNATKIASVSNAPYSAFSKSLEVSSTPTVYTSKGGNTYFITLVLARAGES
jgi:hypothetical protein